MSRLKPRQNHGRVSVSVCRNTTVVKIENKFPIFDKTLINVLSRKKDAIYCMKMTPEMKFIVVV